MNTYPGLTVLFVGDLNPYSNSYARLKGFRSLCGDVHARSHTPQGDNEKGFAKPSLSFRVGWKLGFHLDSERINDWLRDMTERVSPDLVWIEKGNMIRPVTLARLRQICPSSRIVSYSDDDMFAWHNRTWAYQRGLSHYDVVFTTKSYNADATELPRMGARKVLMVDKAFDPDDHRPVDLSPEEFDELSAEVGFIGSLNGPARTICCSWRRTVTRLNPMVPRSRRPAIPR